VLCTPGSLGSGFNPALERSEVFTVSSERYITFVAYVLSTSFLYNFVLMYIRQTGKKVLLNMLKFKRFWCRASDGRRRAAG